MGNSVSENIVLHPHAVLRMDERGVSKLEVIETVSSGEQFPVRFGRFGFRRNFVFAQTWRDVFYKTKQVTVIVAMEGESIVVVTAIARYF